MEAGTSIGAGEGCGKRRRDETRGGNRIEGKEEERGETNQRGSEKP